MVVARGLWSVAQQPRRGAHKRCPPAVHFGDFSDFISDTDDGMESPLSKSADGTRLNGAADTTEGRGATQGDLDRLRSGCWHCWCPISGSD